MTPTMRTLLVLALTALLTVPVSSSARASRPPRFAWPLAPPHQVVRAFEAPPGPFAAGHRGVDLSAPPGATVLAAADGFVVHAGHLADRPLVSLVHPGGLRTTYEPVDPAVRQGQAVRRGDRIGLLRPGHAGCPAEACLHWGAVRVDPPRARAYLDPLRLLSPGRVRLLPRAGGRPATALGQGSRCSGRAMGPAVVGGGSRQTGGSPGSDTRSPLTGAVA